MDWITGLMGGVSNTFWIALVTLVLSKLLPNETLKRVGESLGILATAGLSRIIPFWNKIENLFIDGIDNLVQGFFKGLRSDNPPE